MDALGYYYKSALLANLCAEYKGKWQAASHDKLSLLKLSLCQQSIPHVVTFAYEGNGLTKEYVMENFGEYINGYTVEDADDVKGYKYGLYADCGDDIVVDKDVCSVMWTDGATIVVPKTKCPTIYVSNKSSVSLVCDGFNEVRVYLFDESEITLEDVDENSGVTIYRYSDNAKVNVGDFCLSKRVREFKKQLKL